MLARYLPDTQELHEIVVNTLAQGIYLVDREKNILVWNEMAEKITGYTQDDMLSQSRAESCLEYIDTNGAPLINRNCPVTATVLDGRTRKVEVFLRHKFGYRVQVKCQVQPVVLEGETAGALVSFTESTHNMQEANLLTSLNRLVTTDKLTGLPNKYHTEIILKSMLDDSRSTGANLCVLYINLDDFSKCNDQYGFEAGNRLLVGIADAFRATFTDADLVGRWGGEEFVGVFLAGKQNSVQEVAERARAVIAAVQVPHVGEYLSVTASIGATMVGDSDTAKQLIDRAASLMHVSKISGKDCVTVG